MITLYGIKNCSTMKKTFAWLDTQGIPFQFHDYKKSGVPQAHLLNWINQLGWEPLINKQGTTWRKLTQEEQQMALSAETASALMQTYPSLIKRPLAECRGRIVLGFDPQALGALVEQA